MAFNYIYIKLSLLLECLKKLYIHLIYVVLLCTFLYIGEKKYRNKYKKI